MQATIDNIFAVRKQPSYTPPPPLPVEKPIVVTPGALSEREIEIIRAMVETDGTNDAIADKLTLSTGTVRKHVDNIFIKLGVKTRTQIVIKALKMGIVTLLK